MWTHVTILEREYDSRTTSRCPPSAHQTKPAERLYGIVDGAQDLELAFEAKALYGQNIVSLFQGDMAAAAATVAPYVVPIDPESGYLERWGSRAGRNVGILGNGGV